MDSIISRAILPYRQLLVGISGGLDSTVLLHRLKLWRDQEPNISLRALHVHHGLSPNADMWAEHCSKLCSEWNIPLIIIYSNLTKEKLNIEAKARNARYLAFKENLLFGEVLVIAHHMDDQCETFLLSLKRGSGPLGLSSMSARTKFFNTQLLRPLLGETRDSLMVWAKMHFLHWIEDESNQDNRYDRNFLRLQILPLLRRRWPYISFSINRSASLCKEQENLLNELLAKELATLISVEGTIKIKPLIIMSELKRFALLRRWLLNQGVLIPSRSMLGRIWKEVAKARKDAKPCINLKGYNIRRFKGLLWKTKPQISFDNDIVILWYNPYEPMFLPKGIGKVSLKKGGHVRPPTPEDSVSIRFKKKGLLHIVGRHGGRKLKKIWQELNVPPWERNIIPLLFYGETLIAAANKFVTREGFLENGMYFENEI